MKKIVPFSILLIFLFSSQSWAAQLNIQKAKLTETIIPIRGENGEIISKKIQHTINCKLDNASEKDSTLILDTSNWHILIAGKTTSVKGIKWAAFRPNSVKLIGDFSGSEKITLQFNNGKTMLVDTKSTTAGKTQWGFGDKEKFDYSAQKIVNSEDAFVMEYDAGVDILKHNLKLPNGNLWFRSLSLNLSSSGILSKTSKIRNGTQTNLAFSTKANYFIGGLIYQGEIAIGYQLETTQNGEKDICFDIVNHQPKIAIEAEIPLTNYPIYKLHSQTGYSRLAMPLTLGFSYMPKGEDGNGNETLSRMDFSAIYEIAFSGFFIVQGEWHYSKFIDVAQNLDEDTSFYSVAFAQDLEIAKNSFGFLTQLLGNPDKQAPSEAKNFIFFRISSGKKAPDFQETTEQTFGFGTYF